MTLYRECRVSAIETHPALPLVGAQQPAISPVLRRTIRLAHTLMNRLSVVKYLNAESLAPFLRIGALER